MNIDEKTLDDALCFTVDAETAWMHETCLYRTLNERLVEDGRDPITLHQMRFYMKQRGYRYHIDPTGALVWKGLGWRLCSDFDGDWASCDLGCEIAG